MPLTRHGWSYADGRALLAAESVTAPLAGVAAWLVWRRIEIGIERKRAALRRWGWLMLLSALWPALRAVDAQPMTVLPALLACLIAAGWTALAFRRLVPAAALVLLPFVAWLLCDAALVITRFWIGAI